MSPLTPPPNDANRSLIQARERWNDLRKVEDDLLARLHPVREELLELSKLLTKGLEDPCW